MMKGRRTIAAAAILLAAISFLSADDRDENIDVFVVLDKSLSMVEEIAAVRQYVRDKILDEIIIPGDQLVLIAFYGKAETLYAGTIPVDSTLVHAAVSAIDADGRFTDIGNALDELERSIPVRETAGRRKYMLLITDGKQEAPPESIYYSTELAFNHEFLQNAKEIRMAGWKVHILGVGATSAAKELAEKLSGTYDLVAAEEGEEPLSTEELSNRLAEATDELLSVLEIDETVSIRPVNVNGATAAVFSVTSSGFAETQSVSIDEITLELSDGNTFPVNDSTVTVEIAPAASTKVRIPLAIAPSLAPGSYEGVLTFWFDGTAAFTPGSVRVQFRVKTFLANNIWIIPVAVAVLAACVFGVILLIRKPGAMAFNCEIQDGPARKQGYKLKFGDSLYIIDGVMGFNILPKAGQTPAAKLTADRSGLHLSVTDAKQFSLPSIPGNLIGKSLEVRKKNGKKVTLSFGSE